LEYVIRFLREDPNLFGALVEHSKLLPNKENKNEKYNVDELIGRLKEKEIPLVKKYLVSLAAYFGGGPFEPVYESAGDLLKSLNLSRFMKAPPGYYSEEESLSNCLSFFSEKTAKNL
jgi:hypothetical protein